MRALIFGAGGQLGRALAAAAPGGTELLLLDRSRCDVADEAAVEAAIRNAGADLILNAAAYTAVDRAESEPELAERINGRAPGVMAAAAERAAAQFVHVSTDFVFSGARELPLKPEDNPSPASVYGSSKLAGEQAVQAAATGALIVRTAWVYDAAGSNFVRTMLRLMGEREAVSVVADQVGTPTWSRSLADSIWKLSGLGAQGVLHFTDAGVASWYDFAVAIAEEGLAAGLLSREVAVKPIRTKDYPTPAKRPGYSVLDKSATWELLGGQAEHWRVNLRRCLQEIEKNG